MIKTAHICILQVILLCLLSSSVFAVNLRFLQYSPVEYFTDEGWRLMRETVQQALNKESNGATVEWENSDTKASGSITPLKTFTDNDMPCRETKVFNSAKKQTGTSTFIFCKKGEDEIWKLASPPRKKK